MRLFAGVAVVVLGALSTVSAREVEERDLRMAMGYAQRGLSALQKGNVARAREDFDRALSKMPDLPDAHTGLGHLAMRERRFEDALREYRLAEAGWRDMTSLRIRMETERYARSRDEIQRLRALQLELAQAATRSQSAGAAGTTVSLAAGQLARQQMEIESKIRSLEAMNVPTVDTVKDPPGDVFFFQGNALFDLKRMDEAIAAWEAAAQEMRKSGPLQNNLAVAYWKTGRIDDAWASLRRAEALGFKVNPSFRADLERAGIAPPSRDR
jgi:tetratricopeptide (TPR) repeat protein